MTKLLSIIFTLTAFASTGLANQTLSLEASKGKVEFSAKGPLVRVNGKGNGVTGDLAISNNVANGTLQLDLNSLDSGISLRDDHMKNKYLHVSKEGHDIATLKLKDVALPKNLKGKTKFKGLLTLHGTTQPVSGKVKLKPKKENLVQIDAEFQIKFSDFNIELPSFKLVSVGEEIKIKVSSKAKLTKKDKTTAAL